MLMQEESETLVSNVKCISKQDVVIKKFSYAKA